MRTSIFSSCIRTGIFLLFPSVLWAQAPLPAGYRSGSPVNEVRVWEPRIPGANPDNLTVATPVTEARMATQYVAGPSGTDGDEAGFAGDRQQRQRPGEPAGI